MCKKYAENGQVTNNKNENQNIRAYSIKKTLYHTDVLLYPRLRV